MISEEQSLKKKKSEHKNKKRRKSPKEEQNNSRVNYILKSLDEMANLGDDKVFEQELE